MAQYIRTPEIQAGYNIDHSPKLTNSYTLHCHNFYEIYFFLRGDLDYLVEGRAYRPSPYSMLLIPPNAFHGFQYRNQKTYERYSCHFVADLLPSSVQTRLLSPFHQEDISLSNLREHRLDFYLDSVLSVRLMPESIQQPALQSRMISLLSEIYTISTEQKKLGEAHQDNRYSMDSILIYINDNLTQKMTLDDICNQFYISKNHLNRLFKRATGTTVNSYINYKRLTLAKQYMLQEQTATEAAMNAGFGDYSNFYRTCRNLLNVSPSQLQNQTMLGAKEFWQ